MKLRQALELIDSRCDGAERDDGEGFNKMDVHTANSLLNDQTWSEKQRRLAYKFCDKYSGQLEEEGYSLGDIEDPPSPEDSYLLINFREERMDFAVKLEYGCPEFQSIKKFLKDKGNADWNDRLKTWIIQPNDFETVWARYQDHPGLYCYCDPDEKLDEVYSHRDRNFYMSSKTEHKFDMNIPGLKADQSLMQHQKVAVQYFARNKRVMLCDSMGGGKTVSSLAGMKYVGADTVIVVAPKSAKANWEDECFERFEDIKPQVLQGNDGNLNRYCDYYILNYEILAGRLDELVQQDPDGFILDEFHRIRNSDTKMNKAVKNLVERTNPEYMNFLSGTPWKNKPKELIEPLKILGYLQNFGGWKGYIKRYCDGEYVRRNWGNYWEYEGASNLNELRVRLRRICMIRRETDQIMDTGEKQRVSKPIQIDMEAYREKERQVVERIKRKHREDMRELADEILEDAPSAPITTIDNKIDRNDSDERYIEKVSNRLSRRHGDYVADKVEKYWNKGHTGPVVAMGKIRDLIHWVGQRKVEYVQDFVVDLLHEQGHDKVVVFPYHQDVVEEIADAFGEHAVYMHGGSSEDERERAIDRFYNDSKVKVFVGSIGVSSENIELTASDVIVFAELTSVPGDLIQSEHRIFGRIGSAQDVKSYWLYCKDTVDEHFLKLVQSKKQIFDKGIDRKDEELFDTTEDFRKDLYNSMLDRSG